MTTASPRVRFLHEYYHYVVGMIDKSGIVADRSALNKVLEASTPGIQSGLVGAPCNGEFPDETALIFDPRNGLILIDGSLLRFQERVRVVRQWQSVEVLAYSYHYQSPGEEFFFRFDHEVTPAMDRILKPDYHLHTSARPELHFLSGRASLEYVLEFLKAAILA